MTDTETGTGDKIPLKSADVLGLNRKNSHGESGSESSDEFGRDSVECFLNWDDTRTTQQTLYPDVTNTRQTRDNASRDGSNSRHDLTRDNLTHYAYNESDTDPISLISDVTPILQPRFRNVSLDHCHEIEEDKDNRNKARNQLMIASIVCLLFMVGEIVGGYIANSLAIMTDAAHMLSDFSSFCISLFALWVAKKPATRNMSLGWYRAEVMGAVSSVLIIWVLTGVLVYLAIQRMIHKEFEIDADTMLITAACGVLVNVVMGVLLHQGGHGHSHGGGGHGHSHGGGGHGHSHGATKTEQENINVRAAFIHVLGDLIQSLGVLVAAFLIKFNPTWSLADPICTLVFSVIVLFTTLTIMKDAVHVLMEGVPNNINYKMMEDDLKELSGVVAIHNLHVWSLTLDKSALAVHLAIDPNTSTQELLKEANRLLKKKYRISHCTIQIEFYQRAIMENCKKCQPPTK